MKAIIYTSNTGSTAEYAQLLGNELNLPVHSLQQAKNKVLSGSEIIYLGWIMAGGIKGYKEAAKLYKVRAVCGIGMGQTGTQLKEVRDKNAIPQRIPLFTLQVIAAINEEFFCEHWIANKNTWEQGDNRATDT